MLQGQDVWSGWLHLNAAPVDEKKPIDDDLWATWRKHWKLSLFVFVLWLSLRLEFALQHRVQKETDAHHPSFAEVMGQLGSDLVCIRDCNLLCWPQLRQRVCRNNYGQNVCSKKNLFFVSLMTQADDPLQKTKSDAFYIQKQGSEMPIINYLSTQEKNLLLDLQQRALRLSNKEFEKALEIGDDDNKRNLFLIVGRAVLAMLRKGHDKRLTLEESQRLSKRVLSSLVEFFDKDTTDYMFAYTTRVQVPHPTPQKSHWTAKQVVEMIQSVVTCLLFLRDDPKPTFLDRTTRYLLPWANASSYEVFLNRTTGGAPLVKHDKTGMGTTCSDCLDGWGVQHDDLITESCRAAYAAVEKNYNDDDIDQVRWYILGIHVFGIVMHPIFYYVLRRAFDPQAKYRQRTDPVLRNSMRIQMLKARRTSAANKDREGSSENDHLLEEEKEQLVEARLQEMEAKATRPDDNNESREKKWIRVWATRRRTLDHKATVRMVVALVLVTLRAWVLARTAVVCQCFDMLLIILVTAAATDYRMSQIEQANRTCEEDEPDTVH